MEKTLGRSFLLFFLFTIILSLPACVSRTRYLNEVSERQNTLKHLQTAEEKSRILALQNRNLRARLTRLNRRVGLKDRTLIQQAASFESRQKKSRSALKIASQNLGKQVSLLENELSGKQEALSDLEEKAKTAVQLSSSLEKKLEASQKETFDKTLRFETATQVNKKQLETLLTKTQKLELSLSENNRTAKQRESELRESASAREALIQSLQGEIKQGHVTISKIKNRFALKIVDKILFDSGSTEISDKGLLLLKKIGLTLASVKENNIRIEGHTDNVPIQGRLAARFTSNWELSTARATRVVRHFIRQNVKPERLLAVGLSKYKPIASNDTEIGRQQNRRIEIILAPR